VEVRERRSSEHDSVSYVGRGYVYYRSARDGSEYKVYENTTKNPYKREYLD
jgi:hypothetical protein